MAGETIYSYQPRIHIPFFTKKNNLYILVQRYKSSPYSLYPISDGSIKGCYHRDGGYGQIYSLPSFLLQTAYLVYLDTSSAKNDASPMVLYEYKRACKDVLN